MYNALENTYRAIVSYGVLALEFVGVAIILYSAIRSICMLFTKNPHSRLALAEGIALALEFKLGGEVLRTTIVHEIYEVLLVGAIILLRCALTLLIHWEINVEEKKIRALSELKEK
ncbi:DUF1622 domain-containing protein [Bacillota bacterium Meth-B3]|nr:DUF1622 domain-containing protein [Christensenellaceae bacterium]MEA5065973.1 DUF1622 domain-containing protein [Eubacteriales bacterium]MEA5068784.1 DUF1622 domain-containing protein [Christensenellaceae bacterium]